MACRRWTVEAVRAAIAAQYRRSFLRLENIDASLEYRWKRYKIDYCRITRPCYIIIGHPFNSRDYVQLLVEAATSQRLSW